MGLTPLVSPVGPNFLRDFPGQNALNMDRIDAYAGPCLTTHPLTQITPLLKASATDPTLGTGGYTKAWYYSIFDQIHMWGEFRFGTSGINGGSGIYFLTLPFTVDSFLGTSVNVGNSPTVGNGSTYVKLSNSTRLPLLVQLRTSTQIHFSVRMDSGLANRDLREGNYVTWAAQDGVSWQARFKRVP